MSTGYRVLHADDAFWRPSNATKVLNTDLAKQLGADTLGARLWRLGPGQATTKHRHRAQAELYVLLEGMGRVRIGDEVLTLAPLSALVVDPRTVRQVFNDTEADVLWLVCGAPPEPGDTLEMSPETIADLYPDGLTALPQSSTRPDSARTSTYHRGHAQSMGLNCARGRGVSASARLSRSGR